MPVFDRAKLKALELLPKNAVSRAVGALSDLSLPTPVQKAVNQGFASLASIDTQEAESMPGEYDSLNSFFTRRLKAGQREIHAAGPNSMVSPCDGRISHFGPITNDTLVQAKGREYRLVDLLDSGQDAKSFSGGHFATIYLSPQDYHRVHVPISGSISRVSYIPGYLFPVNPFAVANVGELFAVNERLISHMETPLGKVGVIMVGATCVGRMSLVFTDFVTNQKFRRREEIMLPASVDVSHGDELGMFNLGSTVIILIDNPSFEFDSGLSAGQALRMGQLIGQLQG